jgi:hypothetical protein
VETAVLQDADPHVRLEALLALSEVPGSARESAAILDVITSRTNARDPWIPDAVAMAAAAQPPSLLRSLIHRPVVANDSLATSGMRRATVRIARFHAARADAATVVDLIASVPQATPALAAAMLNGIAEGWPQETAPQFSAEQRATLATSARNAGPEVTDAFAKVAARWNLPTVFKAE